MAYRTTYITTQGAILAAKTLEAKTLQFSRFAVGDGNLENDDIDNIKALTNLVNTIKSFNITKISRETDTQVTVKGLFKNTDVEESFYLKELGLYAIDPDTQEEILFAYINYGDQAEYINNSITEKKEHYYDMIITVDNAENVEITVDPNSVYVTEKQVIEIIEAFSNKGHVYGVRRNIANTNSEWERIEDSIGLVANATKDETEVQNDFDSLYPWSDIISYNYDIEGNKISAFIGEPTFRFDGMNGEVMTRFPEFWYKREQKLEEDGNIFEYVFIADYAKEGFIKSEEFSLSRYTVSGTLERLHSKSGVAKIDDISIENLRASSKKLGIGWGCMDILHWSILQLLYLVEYADYNAQSKLGQGKVASRGYSEFVNFGDCDVLGMKSGCIVDDGLHGVTYRGIENIFGDSFQFCDGLYLSNGKIFISYNAENYNNKESYNEIISGIVGGYCKKVGYDEKNPLLQISVESGGTTNTGTTDIVNTSNEGMAWVGHSFRAEQQAGLWSMTFQEQEGQPVRHTSRLILNK